jgi:hypothetical protein
MELACGSCHNRAGLALSEAAVTPVDPARMQMIDGGW